MTTDLAVSQNVSIYLPRMLPEVTEAAATE